MKLHIEPKGEKGRSFAAECVAYATADVLWNFSQTTALRPVWTVFAGPTEQLRAFTENLRLGHLAYDGSDTHPSRFEFLRSAPY